MLFWMIFLLIWLVSIGLGLISGYGVQFWYWSLSLRLFSVIYSTNNIHKWTFLFFCHQSIINNTNKLESFRYLYPTLIGNSFPFLKVFISSIVPLYMSCLISFYLFKVIFLIILQSSYFGPPNLLYIHIFSMCSLNRKMVFIMNLPSINLN